MTTIRELTPEQQDEIYLAVLFRMGKLQMLIAGNASSTVVEECTRRLAALTEAAQRLNVQRSSFYAAHPVSAEGGEAVDVAVAEGDSTI